MKQKELIVREILFQAIEKNNKTLTQAYLSRELNISLSMVNNTIRLLSQMNALSIQQRSFIITDIKKILYYWASARNFEKDIIYTTRVELPVKDIEKSMPDSIRFTGYSGYKLYFHQVPADYSEVYVYEDEQNIKELEKRFPKNNMPPNLFVLKKDTIMDNYGKSIPLGNIFVDLWNIKSWYAKEFVNAFEEKYHGILE
ncbi:hypothetical protein HYY69_01295 [Candidatus Woesearchaeota archaeon]|nr:hypothetical protein [Candidatus Woesearchaeota archaeon]